MNTNQITNAFNTVFSKLEKIDYSPEWANGTGYFNGAVKDSAIEHAVASTDESGRKIIIVPNRENGNRFNIVFFQRYSDNESFIIVHGVEMAYLKSTGKFAAVSANARLLSYDESHAERTMLCQMAEKL